MTASTSIAFMTLGVSELLVIAVVSLLVFGGRLPEVMRNLGRSYAKFRRGLDEFTRPVRTEMRRLDSPLPPPDQALATTPYEPAAGSKPHAQEPDLPEEADASAPSPTAPPPPNAPAPPKATGSKPTRPSVADEPPPV